MTHPMNARPTSASARTVVSAKRTSIVDASSKGDLGEASPCTSLITDADDDDVDDDAPFDWFKYGGGVVARTTSVAAMSSSAQSPFSGCAITNAATTRLVFDAMVNLDGTAPDDDDDNDVVTKGTRCCDEDREIIC